MLTRQHYTAYHMCLTLSLAGKCANNGHQGAHKKQSDRLMMADTQYNVKTAFVHAEREHASSGSPGWLTITLPVLESFESCRVGIEQAAVAAEHEGV